MDIGVPNVDLAARDAVLRVVQEDKTSVALARKEVDALDRTLAEQWGIDFHEHGTLWDLLRRAGDQDAVDHLRDLWDSISSGAELQDERFYNAMAHPELLGPVSSLRRHLILDVTALSIGLYRRLGLNGPILDAGCHAGTVASLVAEAIGREVIGIDPAEEAIEMGLGHPARHPLASLEPGAMPWKSDRRFDMVVSASAMPWSPTTSLPFLKSVGGLLNPGGIAVVMSVGWAAAAPERVRPQLRASGLGFGLADVAGGYGDIPAHFEAEGIVVLIKGGAREYPRRVTELMESEWDRFRDYANADRRPPREKTQAFERALRRQTAAVA